MNHIIILYSFFITLCIEALTPLEIAVQYALTHQEYIEPTNKNLFYPDFTTYYKQHISSWYNRFFSKNEFPINSCIKKLSTVTQEREKKGYKGTFAHGLRPHKNTHFVVWGDIFGAYHSLVRDLSHLKELGYIDESFRIIKPDCYFVFNGNVINRSPYILETLSLVLDLMIANPENVLYIRGNHEDKQEWHNYSLAKELQIRARTMSNEVIPYESLFDRFFDTLPLALYLVGQENENTINLVRISHYDRSFYLLQESHYAQFFDDTSDKLSTLHIKYQKRSSLPVKGKNKIAFRAIIMGETHKYSYRYNEGILECSTQEESTAWTLFSSPTLIYQRLCDFFFDAFTIINISEHFSDTTITLHNQDVRTKDGFKARETYNLISTQRMNENSVYQPEMQFAATMDLSKSTNTIGKRVDDGLRLRFEVQQDEGGIKEHQPRILTFDDQYTPNITRQKVDFIKNELGIDKLVGSQGSPSLEAYLDMIKHGDVLVLFPFTGAPIFRKPSLKYVAHGVRCSYEYEGYILAQHAYEVLKARRIALFYQNDSFGQGPLKGVTEYFKDKKVTLLHVPHERNDIAFGTQAEKIHTFNPEAILFFATSPATRGLITLMGVDYFASRKMLAISVFEDAFEQFIKDLGISFIFTRMVPNPHTSQLEIAKEYRAQSKKYDLRIDKLAFEMYINASILFYLINRIQGTVTKESIIEAVESTHGYDLKGFPLNFYPETRELSHHLWLDTGGQEWQKIDITPLRSLMLTTSLSKDVEK